MKSGRLVEIRLMAECDDSTCRRTPSGCLVCVAKRINRELCDLACETHTGDADDEESEFVDALSATLAYRDNWRVTRRFYEYESSDEGAR